MTKDIDKGAGESTQGFEDPRSVSKTTSASPEIVVSRSDIPAKGERERE